MLVVRANKVMRDSREAYETSFALESSLVAAQGSLLHKKYLSDIERSYTHSAELTYTWYRKRATTLSFNNEVPSPSLSSLHCDYCLHYSCLYHKSRMYCSVLDSTRFCSMSTDELC